MFAQYQSGKVVGIATYPPTDQAEQWIEVAEDSAEVQAYLNPPPEIKPNWEQFRGQVMIHSAYLRIATATPITIALNPALVWLLGEVGRNPTILPEFAGAWSAIAAEAQPTESEIAALNAIGAACNMPFSLDSNGFMVLT